jgi:cytochrome c-type biogenesis protein CcmH
MRYKYVSILLAILILLAWSPQKVLGDETPTLKELEKDLYCMCGCVKILAYCEMSNCSVSVEMRSQLMEMIEQGLTKEEILERMRKMYGDEVLATPPVKGFSLTLWMYPIIGGGIGLVVLYLLLHRREEVVWHGEPEELLEKGEDIVNEYPDIEDKYEKLFEEEYKKFRRKKQG